MDKILTATDINQQPLQAPLSEFKFRVSAYGILIENNQILLQKNPESVFYCLPGGGVEINESEKDALVREFSEETGYHVAPTKLIDSGFNLFTYSDLFFHNLFLFFEVKKASDQIGPITDPEDSSEARLFDLKSIDLNIITPIHRPIVEKYLCH